MVDHPLFSRLYIRCQDALERFVGGIRAQQNSLAYGKTLILGAGTGLDVAQLSDAVTEIVLLEPDPSMNTYLRSHYDHCTILASTAEAVPAPDQHFDTVISSLVLCTVTDVDTVLQEVSRVLKPQGQYLFMEHVLHHDAFPGFVQKTVTPVWQKVAGGCQLDRDIASFVRRSALTVQRCEIVQDHFLVPILAGQAVRI